MTTSGPRAGEESTNIRELDQRGSDGIEVRLLWNTETEDVLVSVVERDGMGFEFHVPPTEALDAFHHPYAYAPYGGLHLSLAA